jgi:hypothetical protein
MNKNINMCVMLCLAGPDLDATHSRNVIMIQFAVGAAVSVFMVGWRWWKLQESKVRSNWRESISVHLYVSCNCEFKAGAQRTVQNFQQSTLESTAHVPATSTLCLHSWAKATTTCLLHASLSLWV